MIIINVLIIGAAGFVGGYLIQEILSKKDWTIYATKMSHEKINENIEIIDVDILNTEQLENTIKRVNPNYIFHLAAQSSVSVSWENPNITVDINIKGTLNLLDTVRKLNINPRILLIGSGEEYGAIIESEVPIKETNLLRPKNIYAVTKAAQNMIGEIYSGAYNMNIVMVRAFNHIGPGQSPLFVVADFCKQVAMIESGKQKNIIRVGNLKAKRDFTDVRDIVKAYTILIEKGTKGETYNVGSGKAIAIDEILNLILSQAKIKIEIIVDKNKLRPIDVPIIEADISKITNELGWKPLIEIGDTVLDTVLYWRDIG